MPYNPLNRQGKILVIIWEEIVKLAKYIAKNTLIKKQ